MRVWVFLSVYLNRQINDKLVMALDASWPLRQPTSITRSLYDILFSPYNPAVNTRPTHMSYPHVSLVEEIPSDRPPAAFLYMQLVRLDCTKMSCTHVFESLKNYLGSPEPYPGLLLHYCHFVDDCLTWRGLPTSLSPGKSILPQPLWKPTSAIPAMHNGWSVQTRIMSCWNLPHKAKQRVRLHE